MKHARALSQRRWLLSIAATLGFAFGSLLPSLAADEFPFDQELQLDARPMRGSKRLPSLEIGPTGQTVIELWCNRVEGQIVVVEDTITIMAGEKSSRSCSPEQARADDDMLAALAEVTNWRRDGVLVTLTGPKTLRFRIPTN